MRTGPWLAGTYLMLLAWQWVWHFLLPAPWGNTSLFLAMVSSVPLLLPLSGILRGRARARYWGSLLVVLLLIAAITEAWVQADQMLPALAQILLCAVYLLLFGILSRRPTG